MFIFVRGGFKKYQKILDLVAKSLEYIHSTNKTKKYLTMLWLYPRIDHVMVIA